MRCPMLRRDLYDLVWHRPLVHVAKDFGLSDVGLRKICVKHDIPTPPLGYWAKLAHGKPVRQPRLPLLRESTQDEVHLVARTTPDAPEEVVRAEYEARVRELLPANKIAVPAEKPKKLHPAADAIRKSLRRTSPDGNEFLSIGGRWFPHVKIGKATIDRMVTLLDALVRALEVRQGAFEARDDGLNVTYDGEAFSLTIQEGMTKTEHRPTRDELRRQAEHDELRRKYPNTWSDRQVWAKWDYAPSGRLRLEITDRSQRRWDGEYIVGRWSDRKAQRVEDCLNEVMIAIAARAVLIKSQREEALERARLQAEEEDLHRREEDRRQRATNRRQFLLRRAHELKRYRELVDLQNLLLPLARPKGSEPIDKMARDLQALVTEMGLKFEREQLCAEIARLGLLTHDDD
jgi:hypothetical protein